MKVHEEHKHEAHKKMELHIAFVVVSTSRFKELDAHKESSDKSIPLVQKILDKSPNIHLTHSKIIPDSIDLLELALDEYMTIETIDAIIFSGGTGLSPKDITFETIQPQLEKEIPGFGELFRYLSFKEIGSAAMLSRAISGKLGNKVIFLLPGSPNAVKLALEELIIPELPHMIYIINKEE